MIPGGPRGPAGVRPRGRMGPKDESGDVGPAGPSGLAGPTGATTNSACGQINGFSYITVTSREKIMFCGFGSLVSMSSEQLVLTIYLEVALIGLYLIKPFIQYKANNALTIIGSINGQICSSIKMLL